MNAQEFIQKYYIDRYNTDSRKYDQTYNTYHDKEILPLSIADMDFKTCDKITENLAKIAKRGIFGYTYLPSDYEDAFINWHKRRHGITYQKEWLSFTNGAVTAIFDLLNCFTKEDDEILILTPVYHQFKNAILTSKRRVVESPLINDNGYFTIDYENVKDKLSRHHIKAFILCNPHNPVGRVFTKEELSKLFDLLISHDVLIISDEVHSDLIMKGFKHQPALGIDPGYNDHIITITALSKTLNLAVFAHTQVIIAAKELKERFDAYNQIHHIGMPLVFNAYASYFGFKYADEWLDDLIEVIEDNYRIAQKILDKYALEYTVLEGTYLIFINLEKVLHGMDIKEFMLKKWKVLPSFGEAFDKNYQNWVRLNLATSDKTVKEVFDRLDAILKG